MLLDPLQTSSLNRLIAVRFHCNSSETKSLLNLVMCNSSARTSLRYDFDRVIPVNSTNAQQRLALERINTVGPKLPSQVYHVFYSNASSDSIIYILAILCIYFLLFSLLIYANWNTFNHYNHRKKRKQRKRKLLTPSLLSGTPIGALDSVVCLAETESNLTTIGGSSCRIGLEEQLLPDKEPSGTNATTTVLIVRCRTGLDGVNKCLFAVDYMGHNLLALSVTAASRPINTWSTSRNAWPNWTHARQLGERHPRRVNGDSEMLEGNSFGCTPGSSAVLVHCDSTCNHFVPPMCPLTYYSGNNAIYNGETGSIAFE